MPFLTGSWVSVGKAASPKRARSDSGLGFSIPTSKRAKRSLSDGDSGGFALALGYSTQQQIYGNPVLPGPKCVQQLPNDNPDSAQDTPMTDILAETTLAILEDSRQASEALSIDSGSTAVATDPATDVKADEFEDLFKLDLAMPSTEANHLNGPVHAVPTSELFRKLPFKLQVQVFKHADKRCAVGQHFKPLYKQGMLKGYIINKNITSNEAESESKVAKTYIMNDNVDILASALFNKAYMEAYIEEFYSCNEFSFADPRAAMWFFKNLGKRFQYLRQLELIITGGFQEDSQVHTSPIDVFTEITEELWWSVICWLEHRHKVQRLSLIFKKSPSEDELWRKHVDDDKIAEMMLLRQKIVCRLCRCWGIKSVKIQDATNSFFDYEHDVFETQLAMQQTETETENGYRDKRKDSLWDALEMAQKRLGDTSARKAEYIGEYDEDEFANEGEQDRIYEASQIHQSTDGPISNGVSDSRSEYWATEVQEEDGHQKSKGKGKSYAKAAQKSKTAQVIDQSTFQQSRAQPSRISSLVNSIGNNTSSSSTSRHQGTLSTIPANQFYGSSPQQRNFRERDDHERSSSDHCSQSRRSSSNTTYSNGRKQNNKVYGKRRHTEQKLWDYDA